LISSFHELMVEFFGIDNGSTYFDKVCVFLPILFLALLVHALVNYIRQQLDSGNKDKKDIPKTSDETNAAIIRKGKKGKKE
jgi:hypothetical protein